MLCLYTVHGAMMTKFLPTGDVSESFPLAEIELLSRFESPDYRKKSNEICTSVIRKHSSHPTPSLKS